LSIQEKLGILPYLEPEIPFQTSLFRTKSDCFFSKTVLDQIVFQPRTPEIRSPRTEVDQRFHPKTDKLEDLVANIGQALDKIHLQQSVELPSLTIVVVSAKPTPGHSIPPSSLSSISSGISSLVTQVVV
jgi:hypothetical protein